MKQMAKGLPQRHSGADSGVMAWGPGTVKCGLVMVYVNK